MVVQNINSVFILDAKVAFRRQATAGKYIFGKIFDARSLSYLEI